MNDSPTGWRGLKEWSDQYMPAVKIVLEAHRLLFTTRAIITEASRQEDMAHNTDLVVVVVGASKIACRIRSENFMRYYPDEFTIRSEVVSGAKTELEKVLEGWGDYYLYGFGNEKTKGLLLWHICRYDIFRAWHKRELAELPEGCLPGIEGCAHNYEGNRFRRYQWTDLPDGFVIATGGSEYRKRPAQRLMWQDIRLRGG